MASDNALLERVRKLLAKAEAVGVTGPEAEALTAKAAELMARYGIDRALLAAARPETDHPANRVIAVQNPWARVQAHLLCGLASAMRCQCIILPRSRPGTRIHMFGYESDIERADMLYTSVLVQMWQGLAGAAVPAWTSSPRAWRRSWLLGFTTAVIARVRAAEQHAAAEASAPQVGTGTGTGAGAGRPETGDQPRRAAGVSRDPHREGHLQRQRLRQRLRQGPAGRPRRQPAPRRGRKGDRRRPVNRGEPPRRPSRARADGEPLPPVRAAGLSWVEGTTCQAGAGQPGARSGAWRRCWCAGSPGCRIPDGTRSGSGGTPCDGHVHAGRPASGSRWRGSVVYPGLFSLAGAAGTATGLSLRSLRTARDLFPGAGHPFGAGFAGALSMPAGKTSCPPGPPGCPPALLRLPSFPAPEHTTNQDPATGNLTGTATAWTQPPGQQPPCLSLCPQGPESPG